MKKIKVVFMGTPDFCVPILEGLIANYDVLAVVSQPDKKVGRHQILTSTPAKEVALKHNILVLQPNNIKKDYDSILELKPDIIITCAYGQIIPKELLEFPRYGCINVHASLLPKYRGGAPIHRAIIDGCNKTGITIMYMAEGMDSGDIISQRETIIESSDNLESLHDRLSIMGKDLLLETLPSIISGTNERVSQDLKKVSYAYNIKREEEHIDFNKKSLDIFNLIRGLSPVPGSYSLFDDKEMKVYSARIGDVDTSEFVPGKVINVYKDGIGVATKDKEIIFTDVKLSGKKRMSAGSFINGFGKDKLLGKVFK